jgi:hypothetical protein
VSAAHDHPLPRPDKPLVIPIYQGAKPLFMRVAMLGYRNKRTLLAEVKPLEMLFGFPSAHRFEKLLKK